MAEKCPEWKGQGYCPRCNGEIEHCNTTADCIKCKTNYNIIYGPILGYEGFDGVEYLLPQPATADLAEKVAVTIRKSNIFPDVLGRVMKGDNPDATAQWIDRKLTAIVRRVFKEGK